MTKEIPQGNEFMRKPGDIFALYGQLHILAEVRRGQTPADSDYEDYKVLPR